MAIFTVTNLLDSGAGSLSQLISEANNKPGADEIYFDKNLRGKITSTFDKIKITDELSINGLDTELLTIEETRFIVDDKNDATQIKVTISNLTIAGNKIGRGEVGGAISNKENLTINNSTLRNNFTREDGGAIFNFDVGTLEVIDSTISNNSALAFGGGIANGSSNFDVDGGRVKIENSTIRNNQAFIGAGIANHRNGSLIINNSTISENGGITRDPLFGEFANRIGGIYHNKGNITIANSTVSRNKASDVGGIINNEGQVNLKNTIVADNEGLFPDVAGHFTSEGFNLVGDSTGSTGFTLPGDLVGNSTNKIDPLLGSLQNNGGNTSTQKLLKNSPAIDAADPNDFPIIDQRGVTRPQGIRPDIGAFEVEMKVSVSEPSTLIGIFVITIAGASFLKRKRFCCQKY